MITTKLLLFGFTLTLMLAFLSSCKGKEANKIIAIDTSSGPIDTVNWPWESVKFEVRKDGSHISRMWRNGKFVDTAPDRSGYIGPKNTFSGSISLRPFEGSEIIWFSFFSHYGEAQPVFKKLDYKVKHCYEYNSEFGWKPCDSSWVIKDTMKLINALLYDIWSMGKFAGSPSGDSDFIKRDTGDIWYGPQIELRKNIQRLERDSITILYVDSSYWMSDSLYGKNLPSTSHIPDSTIKPSYNYFLHSNN
jgi:hypothetical protein